MKRIIRDDRLLFRAPYCADWVPGRSEVNKRATRSARRKVAAIAAIVCVVLLAIITVEFII